MSNPNLSRRTRLLLGLVVAASILGLVEIGLRLAGVAAAYQGDLQQQWRTTPNLVNQRMRGTREPHDFRLDTNADGLRSALSRDKAADHIRLCVMGDSNVFGWGVGNEETVGARLEHHLRLGGWTQVEVLNAGQPGYSSTMIERLFTETVADYTPDWTIVFVSLHDYNRTLLSDAERARGPVGLRARARSLLFRHSRIYGSLRTSLFPLADKAQLLPHERDGEPRVPRVSGAERDAILHRMSGVADGWGGRVTLGLLPFYADLSQPSGMADRNRVDVGWSRAWTRDSGVPLLDAHDCCGPDADTLVFPYDHGHLNARGNDAVGETLAKVVASSILSSLGPAQGQITGVLPADDSGGAP